MSEWAESSGSFMCFRGHSLVTAPTPDFFSLLPVFLPVIVIVSSRTGPGELSWVRKFSTLELSRSSSWHQAVDAGVKSWALLDSSCLSIHALLISSCSTLSLSLDLSFSPLKLSSKDTNGSSSLGRHQDWASSKVKFQVASPMPSAELVSHYLAVSSCFRYVGGTSVIKTVMIKGVLLFSRVLLPFLN